MAGATRERELRRASRPTLVVVHSGRAGVAVAKLFAKPNKAERPDMSGLGDGHVWL
jgi:hypothetical protein